MVIALSHADVMYSKSPGHLIRYFYDHFRLFQPLFAINFIRVRPTPRCFTHPPPLWRWISVLNHITRRLAKLFLPWLNHIRAMSGYCASEDVELSKVSERWPIFALAIPCSLLLEWHRFLSEISSQLVDYTFLLEAAIKGHVLSFTDDKVKRNETTRTRV